MKFVEVLSSFFSKAKALPAAVAKMVKGWTLQQTIIASVASGLIVIGTVAAVVVVNHKPEPVALVEETEEAVFEIETETEIPIEIEEKVKVQVTLPEYKDLSLSADSIEKDLNVYFTNENGERIAGTQFAVKLLTADSYETLRPYVDKIVELNTSLETAKAAEAAKAEAEEASSEENASKDNTSNDNSNKENSNNENSNNESSNNESSNNESSNKESVNNENLNSGETESTEETSMWEDYKDDKGLIFGFTEEEFETLTEVEKLSLMKDYAISEYGKALKEVEATELVDEDMDGMIYRNDLAAGDFIMCYEPAENYQAKSYNVYVNVKDKIEYKPVENIEKKVVEYDASQDVQQKVEEAPTKPADTVDLVESSKKEVPAKYGEAKAIIPSAEITDNSGVITITSNGASAGSDGTGSLAGSAAAPITGTLSGPKAIKLYSHVANTIEVQTNGVNLASITCASVDGLEVKDLGNGKFSLTASDTKTDKTVTINFVGALATGETGALPCTVTICGSNNAISDAEGNKLYADEEGKTELTNGNFDSSKPAYKETEEAYTIYYGWQNIDNKRYYFDSEGKAVTGQQIINGAEYTFGSDGVLLTSGRGCDVSKWQGSIDWNTVATQLNFTIIRCAYRCRGSADEQRDLVIDPRAEENIRGAKAAGMAVGLYFYSTAMNEAQAVEEASLAVDIANRCGGITLPIYFDFEDVIQRDGLNFEQKTAIAKAFCQTVQAAGYATGVYSYQEWLEKYMDTQGLPASYSVWVAAPGNTEDPCPKYTGRYDIRQYAVGTGSCAGINGAVDLNISYFNR